MENPSTSTPSTPPPQLEQTLRPLLQDFVADLTLTFPEKSYLWQHWKDCDLAELTRLKDYFVSVYPERFFDIIYQNEKIFKDPKMNTCFLPHVQFSELFALNITEHTKQTLWKYLQLILLQIVNTIENKSAFGDAAQMFQGMDEGELQNKMNETLDGLKEFFGEQKAGGATATDGEQPSAEGRFPFDKMFENLKAEDLQEQLKKLMGGKIGSLVQELVEEMKDDLAGLEKEFTDMDPANISMPDIMKKMMKDPVKMMSIMKKMADKVKSKMEQDGGAADYMQETTDILKQMGGKDEFMKMFEQMRKGMPNGKNMKMDENALNRMEKNAKMKERMRQNIETKKAAAAAAAAGCRVEQSSNGNRVFRVDGGETAGQSTKEDIDRIMADLKLDDSKPATTQPPKQGKKKNNKKK